MSVIEPPRVILERLELDRGQMTAVRVSRSSRQGANGGLGIGGHDVNPQVCLEGRAGGLQIADCVQLADAVQLLARTRAWPRSKSLRPVRSVPRASMSARVSCPYPGSLLTTALSCS